MNIAHIKHALLDLRKALDLSVKPYNSFEVDAQIHCLWHVIEGRVIIPESSKRCFHVRLCL